MLYTSIMSAAIVLCSGSVNASTINDGFLTLLPEQEDSIPITPPSVEYDQDLEIEKTCVVKQFAGRRSYWKRKAKKIAYYSRDRIAYERDKGFRENSIEWNVDATYTYQYRDSLLVQRKSCDELGDSTIMILVYDSTGQISKDIFFNKRDSEGSHDDAWMVASIRSYRYDTLGRKVETYADSIHWGSQNRYTWSYDERSRVLEHRSYNHDRLLFVEEYKYNDTSYQFIRTWYDNGVPRPSSTVTNAFFLDASGRDIEKVVTAEDGKQLSKTTYGYDSYGRVSKIIVYGMNNEVVVTHIYKYKSKKIPTKPKDH